MTTVNPATSVTPAAAPSAAQTQLAGNFDTFLKLLTTQLQNQDPLSPMDSNQFTQQLVEFSQVEQQINTNDNLKTLINQGSSQTGAYAVSYLGKTVTINNGNAPLTNGAATWSYNLGTLSAQTALTVTDANGNAVFSGAGETAPGAHDFAWNGQNANGTQLPDGVYTLHVTAKAPDGSAVTSSVSSKGVVSEVDMTGGTPQLLIGSMPVSLSDVAGVSVI
jgi:flagellar basal-body rod modification protein FlgD